MRKERSSSFLKSFLRDDDGQAIVEYILLLSAVMVGTAALARILRDGMDKGVLRLGGQLEKDLHTGRGPIDDYRN